MRLIEVNDLQDIEHRGHHLDCDMEHRLHRFGDNPHQKPLEVLQRIIISAPRGFEVVVAVAVSILTEDGSFHFGDNDFSKSKRDMAVMRSNHVMLWLRDEENRGRYQLGSMFHDKLMSVAAECKPKDSGPMLLHVRQTIARSVIVRQAEIIKEINNTANQLIRLHADNHVMIEQYRNVAHA